MERFNLAQELKINVVVFAVHAHCGDSEIVSFLNVAKSFVFKAKHVLETSDGDTAHVARRQKHSPRSDVIQTTEYSQTPLSRDGASGRSNGDHVMPQHFFQESLSVNATGNIRVL